MSATGTRFTSDDVNTRSAAYNNGKGRADFERRCPSYKRGFDVPGDAPGEGAPFLAESRGGDITIDINEEAFVFIYRSFPEPE